MPANPLLRPTENPATRFGGMPAPVGRQLPLNALRMPPQRSVAPVLPAAPLAQPQPGPMMPGVQGPAPPQPASAASVPLVPEAERISPRVPVPKADFPEGEHKDLHEKTMGKAFDEPGAQNFVRDLYAIVRKSRPHIAPRHLLETVRDAHHAMHHGFMTPQQVGGAIGRMAELRHAQAQALAAGESPGET
jgi:hypothetical protein